MTAVRYRTSCVMAPCPLVTDDPAMSVGLEDAWSSEEGLVRHGTNQEAWSPSPETKKNTDAFRFVRFVRQQSSFRILTANLASNTLQYRGKGRSRKQRNRC